MPRPPEPAIRGAACPSSGDADAEIAIALFGLLWLWSPSGLYLWLKAFHVIAVIAWMAGMLYLPRLFELSALDLAAAAIADPPLQGPDRIRDRPRTYWR